MSLLLKSINDAEAKRDAAQEQAEAYRARAESLEEAEGFHQSENRSLARVAKDQFCQPCKANEYKKAVWAARLAGPNDGITVSTRSLFSRRNRIA